MLFSRQGIIMVCLGILVSSIGQVFPGETAKAQADTPLPSGAIVRLGIPHSDKAHVQNLSAAFLPDGRTIAITGTDKRLSFWNVRTGKLIRVMDGHLSAKFSLDGKMMASTKDWKDEPIRLFSVETGKVVAEIPTSKHGTRFFFSPDGSKLAVDSGINARSSDPPLRLLELPSCKEIKQFQMRRNVGSLAFSPDGKRLATAQGFGKPAIQVWDTSTGKDFRLSFKDLAGNEPGWCLTFSSDSKFLAGINSLGIGVWDAATGKLCWMRTFLEWKLAPCSVAYSPNGQLMGIGSGKGSVCLVEAATGRERARFEAGVACGEAIAFSRCGLMLASLGEDATVLVWDVSGKIRPAGKVIRLNAKELDARWSNLAGEDAAEAWQAIRALVARPDQAVTLLKERLPPNKKLDARTRLLLADLDSEDFGNREQASGELAKLGFVIGPNLRKLKTSTSSKEVQKRVAELLEKLGEDRIATEELRCSRAVEILEYIGTNQARKLLAVQANGEPGCKLTHDANEALNRLAK